MKLQVVIDSNCLKIFSNLLQFWASKNFFSVIGMFFLLLNIVDHQNV